MTEKVKVRASAIETFIYIHTFELDIPGGLSGDERENYIYEKGLEKMENLGPTRSEYEAIDIYELNYLPPKPNHNKE
jgi:hypothetical protein